MAFLVTAALLALAAVAAGLLALAARGRRGRASQRRSSGSLDALDVPGPASVGIAPAKALQRLPGPRPWPVLGSLHLLGQHEVPFQALTALSRVYGDVYAIVLGSTPCVVVNSFELIREVLISKGGHFGGRPDFMRFHALFGGDRNNSLALCDWSELQKTRRSIARMYCSPRTASAHFDSLAVAADFEAQRMMRALDAQVSAAAHCGGSVRAKPLLQLTCANIFTSYMCSSSFDYDDPGFRNMVNNFDEIFWEINQGYAVDFLPWLRPAYSAHLRKIQRWASEIRDFIMAAIIEPRRAEMAAEGDAGDVPPRDFTEALLRHLEADPDLNWEHVIFELEDFVGGHSAVGNLTWLMLAAAARDSRVTERVRAEADAVTAGGARPLGIFDRARMPYTDACILETLRVASSPIVPHVCTQDTDIAGYAVEKGTVVFLNNYELNASAEHWSEPECFQPERFLSADGSRVVKPDFFIPFSTGKRTCIGQRLVQSIAFLLAGSVLQRYDVTVDADEPPHSLPACVAVPPHTFPLLFRPRASSAA